MMAVQPRTSVWIALLLLAMLGFALRTGATEEQPPQTTLQKAASIKSLLKERHDALKEVLDILARQLRMGKVQFDSYARAQRDALRAAADLADTPKDRIAALRGIEDVAKANEEFFEVRAKSGFVATPTDLLQAKAMRLEAQIELLREELKAG
jgi:hypothetical protein